MLKKMETVRPSSLQKEWGIGQNNIWCCPFGERELSGKLNPTVTMWMYGQVYEWEFLRNNKLVVIGSRKSQVLD